MRRASLKTWSVFSVDASTRSRGQGFGELVGGDRRGDLAETKTDRLGRVDGESATGDRAGDRRLPGHLRNELRDLGGISVRRLHGRLDARLRRLGTGHHRADRDQFERVGLGRARHLLDQRLGREESLLRGQT
ncbi:hypothetical protein E3T25_00930 [Cryobacterium sandaracinum]|uniref:Uncharacterized protein n=1 Tax=Cryobacterium sandaracinum TaxID=1259247 RepID=A0ABY2JJ73_9MICO|nr:hypothetical protein [Cryobacterium sandaracinum]TFD06727.1 hypothetical protein E3T25_00930 [Cryobacterium sandaracinum]